MPRIPCAFTLIELAVVSLILAIATAAALPAWGQFLATAQLRQAAGNLADDLASARRTAINRSQPITICPSGDGRACLPGGCWQAGWIIRDGGRVFTAHSALPSRLAASASEARPHIRFDPSGLAPGGNTTITLCVRKRPASAVSVVISSAGRIHTEAATAGHAAACAAFRENNR
jgi:type IV fimbrial biogenesis protein FimT